MKKQLTKARRDHLRKEFEYKTWQRANDMGRAAVFPILYDAGLLGFCELNWTGTGGGHWTNKWFDNAVKLT